MANNKKVWKVHEKNSRLQQILSSELGISSVVAQILINRGIQTPGAANMFLFGDISLCPDPYIMKDMARAVERVKKAVQEQEKILIYGDYDVDGVTSTALLADVFEKLGANFEAFIPNRLEEGYGLDKNAVIRFAEKGVSLIVTVDCGINSSEEVDAANNLGMDVVITDHHEVRGKRPAAFAAINPHQDDCEYPFEQLAGVGVAYKFARALMKGREDAADDHLDLVALGTVADVVPLNGENRVLVKKGLRRLRITSKPGLKALMEVSGIDPEKLNSRHIGFVLAPRINAMGRLGTAETALKLLMCKDPKEAYQLAQILDKENRLRQNIEKSVLEQALLRVEKEIDPDRDKIIVLADEAWHAGVIGIVASRLTETYNMPAVLISLGAEEGKGSARGIKGFNLFEAISRAGEHLIGFGGHKAACGIRIKREKIDSFRESINSVAPECFEDENESLEFLIDFDLPFSYITPKFIDEIEMLMPHGPGNREPVFCSRGLEVKNTPRDLGKNGFKFLARCGSLTCEAITFKKNKITKPSAGDIINLAYAPSINSWGGYDTIQLNIKDLQYPAGR